MELDPTLQGIINNQNLRWIFVGGKGGVGKTTTAAALAILLAKHRETVLIISTDPAHSLSDALDQKMGQSPTRIGQFHNLYGMQIKPDVKSESLQIPTALNIQDDESTRMLVDQIMNSVPGIDECISFSELIYSAQAMSFSVVVFDTAPTGHTMRLLNFPQTIDKGLSKIVSLKENIKGFVSQFSSLFGYSQQGEDMYGDLFQKLEEMKIMVDQMNEQFTDHNLTTFVAVCIPEFLSLFETERLVQELFRLGIEIEHIVVNFVLMPKDSCRKCTARQRMQEKYLQQLREMYDDFHLVFLPLQENEVRGIELLDNFSQNFINHSQLVFEQVLGLKIKKLKGFLQKIVKFDCKKKD